MSTLQYDKRFFPPRFEDPDLTKTFRAVEEEFSRIAKVINVNIGAHGHPTSDIISGTFDDARIAESNVTQHEGAIDHDELTNFEANEHYVQSAITELGTIAGNVLLAGGDDQWIQVDSNTRARFILDSHDDDAVFHFQEDNVDKWLAGFDFSENFDFIICEGALDTVRLRIAVGGAVTIPGTLSCGYLTVTDSNETIRLVGGGSGDANKTWIAFYDSNGTTRRGYVGEASGFNTDIYLASDTGNIRLISGGGNVLIETLTLADGSITDSGGAISFGNENLLTTGTLGCGVLTSGNIIIPNSGYIGSVSDPDAIQIEADGDVVMSHGLLVTGSITLTVDTVNGIGFTINHPSATGYPNTPLIYINDDRTNLDSRGVEEPAVLIDCAGGTNNYGLVVTGATLLAGLRVDGNLAIVSSLRLGYPTSGHPKAGFLLDHSRDETHIWVTADGGNQLILSPSNTFAQYRDYDHGLPTNPTFFVQSATDPNTDNAQWLSLAHDQTNAVFGLGSGAYTFPDGNVGIGLTPTANMAGVSIEAGLLTLKETTTPTADVNYGKIYTKDDNKLYCQTGDGVEHEVAFVP